MNNFKQRIDAQAESILQTAMSLLEKDDILPIAFGLHVDPKAQSPMMPLTFDKAHWRTEITKMIDESNISAVIMVSEAWVGTNTTIAPSEDPEKTEAILVTVSSKGYEKAIILPFEKVNGKTVFGEKHEHDGKILSGLFFGFFQDNSQKNMWTEVLESSKWQTGDKTK